MSRNQHDVTIQETVNCINCVLSAAVRSTISGVTDHCVVHQEVGYIKMTQLTFAWKVTVLQLRCTQGNRQRKRRNIGPAAASMEAAAVVVTISASSSAVVLSGIPAGFSYQSERRK